MSRNSLFTFWDDVIAIGLSYYYLQEIKYLNLGNAIGIILSVLAVILFAVRDYQKKGGQGVNGSKATQDSIGFRFYCYVGVYSVVWGVATFLMRKWGVERIPIGLLSQLVHRSLAWLSLDLYPVP